MINFIVPRADEEGIHQYLGLWGKDIAPRLRVIRTESLATQTTFTRGTYVLAAMDQYSSGMRAFVTAVHASLETQDGVRFLNHPTRTLQRFELLDALYRSGRNEFRAVRVTDAWQELRFPLFVRDGSNHDGALSPLLHSVAEVERAIGDAVVRGHLARNLMVVEFCDTSDRHGSYRKYSAFVVGRHVIPRYLSISNEWMLKFAGGAFTRAIAEEEVEYLTTNPHEAALREIFDLANVGYGRIDYGMKAGRVQTWEINLNPTIGRGLRPSSGRVPPEIEVIRKPGKEIFYRRFREAWEEVDLAIDEAPVLTPIIDPDVVRAASLSDVDDRWISALKRVLRPAKQMLSPVVSRALPMIGRAAARRVLR